MARASSNILTGDKELDARLKRLADPKASRRIARKGLAAGLAVFRKEAKRRAPNARIKKSIGSTNKKNRSTKLHTAKVGANVGVKKSGYLPQLHLLILGTVQRFRKKVGGIFAGSKNTRTGKIEPNDFVKEAATAKQSAAVDAMRAKVFEEIAKEAQK